MINLPPGVKSSVVRINNGQFTDSDVRSLLIGMRLRCGILLQELGDLVAHHDRDRGKFLNHILLQTAQAEMFTKYFGDKKLDFPADGTCDWWLKPLLLYKMYKVPKSDIKRKLGVIPIQLEREVKKYFPPDVYPTKLIKLDRRFFDIVNCCMSWLTGGSLFSQAQLESELESLCRTVRIDAQPETIRDLIASMLVIIHNSTYSLPSNVFGKCKLVVKTSPESSEKVLKKDGVENFVPSPHGKLSIFGSSPVLTGPYANLQVAASLIETNIESNSYLDPSLIETVNLLPRFNLSGDLKFEKQQQFPVSLIV